jgi:serine/threonine protein kinase
MSNISGLGGARSANCSANNSEMGSASDSRDQSLDELVGSEYYISPEMLENRTYSYASDLWALGIMIYQFFAGKVPFKGKNQEETFELIKKCQLSIPEEIPQSAKDLIAALLVKQPESRLGAQDILDVKSHPFFDGIDFSTIEEQLPPQKFELHPVQKTLVKYLPKKMNAQVASSPVTITT